MRTITHNRHEICLVAPERFILVYLQGGEEMAEIVATMRDLRRVECDVLTIGQYLRPSARHLPVARFYHPDEFAELKRQGEAMRFVHVEAGPLVRSSYHARSQLDAASGTVPA